MHVMKCDGRTENFRDVERHCSDCVNNVMNVQHVMLLLTGSS